MLGQEFGEKKSPFGQIPGVGHEQQGGDNGGRASRALEPQHPPPPSTACIPDLKVAHTGLG